MALFQLTGHVASREAIGAVFSKQVPVAYSLSRNLATRAVFSKQLPVTYSFSRNFSIKKKLDDIRDTFSDKYERFMDATGSPIMKLFDTSTYKPPTVQYSIEEKKLKSVFTPGITYREENLDENLKLVAALSPEERKKNLFNFLDAADFKGESIEEKQLLKHARQSEISKIIYSVSKRSNEVEQEVVELLPEKIHENQRKILEVLDEGSRDNVELDLMLKELDILQIMLPSRDILGRVSDPGESFGTQKEEFDSWKRIYKEDEMHARLGLPPRAHYWKDGIMYSAFGTLSNPVKIYSQFSHRVIGCRGGNGRPHEVLWINLGNKYKTMCPECGQMFILVNFLPAEHEERGENLNDIEVLQNDGHLKEPKVY